MKLEVLLAEQAVGGDQQRTGQTQGEREGDPEEAVRRSAPRLRAEKPENRETHERQDEHEPEYLRQREVPEPGGRRRADGRDQRDCQLPGGGRVRTGPPRNRREQEAQGEAEHEPLDLRDGVEHRAVVGQQARGVQQPMQHAGPGQEPPEGEEQAIRLTPPGFNGHVE